MPLFTWTQHPVSDFDTKYHCGDPIPAINDLGFLYIEPEAGYIPVEGVDDGSLVDTVYSMEYCDPDTGSSLFHAWHRQDRAASICFSCDQLMTIEQYLQLPFCGDGSTIGQIPTPPIIPDPGPPPP